MATKKGLVGPGLTFSQLDFKVVLLSWRGAVVTPRHTYNVGKKF